MNVVGIDPSLAATGIAGIIGELDTITDPRKDERLLAIFYAVQGYADRADLAVVEDLPFNAQSAGATGMAQGVVRLALMQLNVPYILLAPATLKKFATGSGVATKADMRMALYKRTGMDVRDDNQVDAWFLRQAGLARFGHGETTLPVAQVRALDKLDWSGPGYKVIA